MCLDIVCGRASLHCSRPVTFYFRYVFKQFSFFNIKRLVAAYQMHNFGSVPNYITSDVVNRKLSLVGAGWQISFVNLP